MNLLFSQIKTFNSTLILCTHDQRIKKLFSNVLEITK
jgi:ABC-type lipoprotein export system ATPase subunit